MLDDAPAREAELFLVDGNNLAYRAFFALPEELATSDGQPTNALLGFTNMLFKLLADYRPKGVAVAWDSRPVERAAAAESAGVIYKEGRRPMPDLLREQFPHLRPIVEAFGYRNLEFEGWEADDVIATLATRADEAGIRTCVVSTDRDAFQLVSENVCLMMTPRGVADVNVYTPERVEARYGIRPDADPGLHRAEGRHERQHPRHPGDRRQDRRAADRAVRLARGGRRARVRALARAREERDRVRGAGRGREAARDDAARPRHRLRPGRARARAARPLAAQGDLPPLRVPQPARPRRRARRRAARGADGRHRRRGAVARGRARRSRAASGSRRTATARRSRPPTASSSGRGPARVAGELVVHDAKALGVDAADDTLLAAYLIEPGRADVRPLRPRGRVRRRARPDARDRGGDRRARPRRRAAAPARRPAARAARGARPDRALPRGRAAADAACSPRWSAPA